MNTQIQMNTNLTLETANQVHNRSVQEIDICTDVMSIQLLKDSWKQNTNCRDKTEMYRRIMGLFTSNGEEDGDAAVYFGTVWQSCKEDLNTKVHEGDKQYATAIVLMKDNEKEVFQAVLPDFPDKKKESGSTTKKVTHSEEILIKKLDDFLRRNGTMAEHILIYTHNSPCLKQCMFQLLDKAYEWREHYEVSTDVAFTKFWGLSGPNYFRNLKYSIIDKTEMYHRIMGLFPSKGEEDGDDAVYFGTVWQSCKEDLNTKVLEGDKQYAIAIVLMKDNEKKVFQAVHPDFQNKKKESGAPYTKADQSGPTIKKVTHSEEILIKQLDDFLRRNGTMAEHIFIYTHNSPCLKRENQSVPCMFQLLHKAYEWRKLYEVSTDVAFTKLWGLSGPNYFKNLNYSIISCPSSDFHSHIEKCKDIDFKLDHKNLWVIYKKSDIYNTLSHVKDKDKNTLLEDIKSARKTLVSLAESSFGLRDDHLDRGKQTIDSFNFLPAVHDNVCEILQKEWKEMVNNSSMTPIREHITEGFNSAVVHLFREELKSFLGNSSPLQLHRVPLM